MTPIGLLTERRPCGCWPPLFRCAELRRLLRELRRTYRARCLNPDHPYTVMLDEQARKRVRDHLQPESVH